VPPPTDPNLNPFTPARKLRFRGDPRKGLSAPRRLRLDAAASSLIDGAGDGDTRDLSEHLAAHLGARRAAAAGWSPGAAGGTPPVARIV
jgi:hypothetical protein